MPLLFLNSGLYAITKRPHTMPFRQ